MKHEIVRWWKSKEAWLIISIAITAMVTGAVTALYTPYPYGLLIVVAIAAAAGISIRKIAIRLIEKIGDNEQ